MVLHRPLEPARAFGLSQRLGRRKLGVLVELGHVTPHPGSVKNHKHARHASAFDAEPSRRVDRNGHGSFPSVLHISATHLHATVRFSSESRYRIPCSQFPFVASL